MTDVAGMKVVDVEGVAEIRVMQPKPGDVYCVTTPHRLKPETIENFRAQWNYVWGPNAPKVMFIQDGAKIELVKSEEVGA